MRIANGQVFNGEAFERREVAIEGDRFVRDGSAEAGEAVIDAAGCYVIPGLVDVHFHGCMGADLCDGSPEGLASIAAYEASRGITAICPATMTFPEPRLTQVLAAAREFVPEASQAALVGVNLEGPFISPDKVGAQNPAYVRPASADEFRRLQAAAGGLIKLVDIAPEEPGACEFTRAVANEVRVSVAHTCADYESARAAFDNGARQVTHLFNAMPPLHHREPGPIAAAAEHPQVTPELIADGVHVHPAMVRLAFALFGADRMILISDSMRACGLDDGVYDLGGQEVTVTGNRAVLADGTLAGSVTDLMGCMLTAVRDMDIPLEQAVRAATVNPARAIGVYGEHGSLEPGALANAVVLDHDLNIKHVVVRGELLA